MSSAEKQKPLSITSIWKQAVVGISDGMIISLAVITAIALTNATHSGVIMAGCALAFAGMAVMGIGGYYAARFRMNSLKLKSEEEEQEENKAVTEKTIDLFKRLNLGEDMQKQAASEIEKDSAEWKDFLQKNDQPFELPDKKQLPATGFIIGLSFFAGAIFPLIAYFIFPRLYDAIHYSVVSTLIVLPVTGYLKSSINGEHKLWGAARVLLLGGAAVAATWMVTIIFSR